MLVRKLTRFLTVPSLLLIMLPFIQGCGEEKLVHVKGKVMLGKTPITQGLVSFGPAADKNNTRTQVSAGKIAADGTFELLTNGKPGAPLGWYKVAVAIHTPDMTGPMPTMKINEKFTTLNSTPIRIEVVETPSATQYDIQITP